MGTLRRESAGLEAREEKPAGDASLSASRMCNRGSKQNQQG